MPRKRSKYLYREVFFAHEGPGPYRCFFCGKPVVMDEVIVHHIDEDRTNNAIENLAGAHDPCHTSHHQEDWQTRNPSRLRAVGAAVTRSNRSRVATTEYRRKLSDARRRDWAPGGKRRATQEAKEAAHVC